MMTTCLSGAPGVALSYPSSAVTKLTTSTQHHASDVKPESTKEARDGFLSFALSVAVAVRKNRTP